MRIIAGPCQHESLAHSRLIAEHCKEVCTKHNVEYVFKASYDKANRTSAHSARGIGRFSTLTDFAKLKEQIPDLTILTDVHSEADVLVVEAFKNAVDVLQIPALLSRQTDLIQAASATGKIVNVKKGQFMAPWDVAGILTKTAGAKEVWITERGTSFGYNTLVVDYTGIEYMLNHYDNVVFDVTHSVQTPASNGLSTGGNRDYVPGLARAASAMGVQNFFLEVHNDPDNAPSDGPSMIHLVDFEMIVKQIIKYNYASR